MKIPDDIFENRCRYCKFGIPEHNNQVVPENILFSYQSEGIKSCQIFAIAQYGKIPGECLDFSPRAYFGICQTCAYSSSFCDGFCRRDEQPNKRQLFLGYGGCGNAPNPDYWQNHCLSTCDNYKVSAMHEKWIIEAVTKGRSPANFDPITMKAIEPARENAVVAEWAELQAAAAEKDRKAAAERMAKRNELLGVDPDQMSMFGMEQEDR